MKITDIMIWLERVKVKAGIATDTVSLELDGNWKKEDLEQACEEACDILYDYSLLAEQLAKMTEKYGMPAPPVKRKDRESISWRCPECQKAVNHRNRHCPWCGKALGWDCLKGERGCRKK